MFFKLIFLKETNITTEKELLEMSLEDQQNTLIAQLTKWTENPVFLLQRLSNNDLVKTGCAFLGKCRMATVVVSFEWDIDKHHLINKIPTFLSQQLNNNWNSTVPMINTFIVSKTVTESMTFEQTGEVHMDFSEGFMF